VIYRTLSKHLTTNNWLKLPYLITILIFQAGCTPLAGEGGHLPAELTIAAASDLMFAFQEIAELWEQETGAQVTLVFGSTGLLTQQIEHGAPYDLFAAANVDFINRLAEQDLVFEDSIQLYARGRIVIAVYRDSGLQAQVLEDLLDPRFISISIANPEHAPYGLAARQALESLDLWEELQPRLAIAENVRQALQFVQTGNAQVGIVALSVVEVPEVTWTLIEESLHEPLDQALAVISSTQNEALARDFAAFINSEQGRLVMQHYGFELPEGTDH
jgi:molybdate transport system substrate-binding protein